MKLANSLCASIVMGLVACGGSDPAGQGGAGSTTTSTGAGAADCPSRCVAKAEKCGAPAADATSACSSVCTGATEAEVSCLESTSCQNLASPATAKSACGISGSATSGSTTTTAGSGAGGGMCGLPQNPGTKVTCDCFGNGGEIITVCVHSGDDACMLACEKDCGTTTQCK